MAAASGEQVDVYGHSHGGIVAFGAATLTAEPQVLEVLAYLMRHRDRLVTKHELMEQVWNLRPAVIDDPLVGRRLRLCSDRWCPISK